jgi:A/G-specific adenine glycosylase
MNTISTNTAEALTGWYINNKRSLPWRDTGMPYDVWLSEIMLQQTRIEAVKPKFLLFKKDIPDIPSLAQCDRDHLMRLWEGLGYYSRAVNLQKCAQTLVNKYNGKLPEDYKTLCSLPGIGPYTAGAVSSIAYGKPVPAVDGNVLRVLTRYFAISKDVRDPSLRKEFEKDIRSVFEQRHDPDFVRCFNQGLMELGETVCVPNGAPHCMLCPWKDVCSCCRNKSYDRIPYRSPLKKRKIIERTLFIIRDGDTFLLHKRPDTGLLAGLYEFPGIERKLSRSEAIAEIEKHGIHAVRIKALPSSKHIFTHLEWHMTAYEITSAQIESLMNHEYICADKKELSKMAVPSAFKKYLDWYELRD